MKTYPVQDRLTLTEAQALGVDRGNVWRSIGLGLRGVRAISTGVKRRPEKGEWYLSGAIPEAYRALNDLDHPYIIARIVKVRTEEKIIIEKTL